jgi:hypothetical protein
MDRLEYFARSKWWAKPCGQFLFCALHADTVTDELIYTPLIIILVISQNLFDRMLKNQRIQPQSIAYDFICEEDGKVITGSANQTIRKRHITCVGSKSVAFLRMLYKP